MSDKACDYCGFKNPEGGLKTFRPGDRDYLLCEICYCTPVCDVFCGTSPTHPDPVFLKTMVYIGNLLRKGAAK